MSDNALKSTKTWKSNKNLMITNKQTVRVSVARQRSRLKSMMLRLSRCRYNKQTINHAKHGCESYNRYSGTLRQNCFQAERLVLHWCSFTKLYTLS